MWCDSGLLAGVILLSVITALLLCAVVVLVVRLVADVRRPSNAPTLRKQSSVDSTYDSIYVRIPLDE